MITATSINNESLTEITNGEHTIYADAAVEKGGSGEYMRPGDILASAYAGCMNITTRRILRNQGLTFEKVIVKVELDRNNPEKTIFQSTIEIIGELTEKEKKNVLKQARECAVCSMLKGEKEFVIADE